MGTATRPGSPPARRSPWGAPGASAGQDSGADDVGAVPHGGADGEPFDGVHRVPRRSTPVRATDHPLYAAATYGLRVSRLSGRTAKHAITGARTCTSGRREKVVAKTASRFAFALLQADETGDPRKTFLSSLGYSRDDLRDRNVLDLAERMRAEVGLPERRPSSDRVTDAELDRMPL